jgi:type II secretory pathway component GspD/PulD (secretin)
MNLFDELTVKAFISVLQQLTRQNADKMELNNKNTTEVSSVQSNIETVHKVRSSLNPETTEGNRSVYGITDQQLTENFSVFAQLTLNMLRS